MSIKIPGLLGGCALLFTACVSTPEQQSKRQLIEQYRTEHGDNWRDWSKQTRAEFEKKMSLDKTK